MDEPTTGQDACVYTVSEPVDYSDVHLLMKKVELFIDNSDKAVQIRFADLKVSNSLMVALMMAWYRRAELAEKQISFHQLPDGIRQIVKITGLMQTLPILPVEN